MSASNGDRRHLLLVGLPGAGKSTIGALIARELKTRFIDLDELIEEEQGATIRELFATRGESEFRLLEREAAGKVLSGKAAVLAPGGGWAAQPGAMEDAGESSLIIYLRTRPEIAARRVGSGSTRPLLAGNDPVERMRDLLGAREEFYERAEVTVDTDDCTPQEVAAKVLMLARSRAGW